MYYSCQINSSKPVDIESVMSYFEKSFQGKYEVEKASMPGRDFILKKSSLVGIFLSVKPNDKGAMLKFNACPPSVLLRLLSFITQLICMMKSGPIVDDIKALASNTKDMSVGS